MNILIVEGNRHMRRMLMEMVGAALTPHPVLEAADASSALLLARAARPGLVLMDVGLPDANGIELTAEIKSLLPESRVVIVSDQRTRASQDAAYASGAAAYVFRDDVYETLLPTLTRVLAQSQSTTKAPLTKSVGP
jgi:DNA-binding NarL/FixJ family response regulator